MELGVATTADFLNPDVGDLALNVNALEVVRTVLADEVSQRLHVRLNFFKGEWFANLDAGTPYYQNILVKGPTDLVIRTVFTNVVQGTEGVRVVESLTYQLNKSTRELTLQFKARLEDGTIFESTDFAPFVVLQ